MKIPYFKQKKDYYCGPAVIQMALASFGIKKSQDILAKELKTKNDNIGTKNSSMVKVCKKYIPEVKHREDRSISKMKKYLNKNYLVIVSYFYEPDKTGHFAIVEKITEKNIYLTDPEDGPNKSLELKHFNKIWYDNERNVGWHLALKK